MQEKRTSWKAFVFVFLLVLLGALMISLFSDAVSEGKEQRRSGWYSPVDKNTARIGFVEIKGVILESEETVEQLKGFDERKDIDFVVVRIDSPGGSVGPSQEIFDMLQSMKKKVLVSMGGVAASGGYYIACGGDLIFANRGTITGSIGVISQFADLSELYAFLKVKPWTLKSGKFKDAGTTEHAPSEADKEYLQNLVNELYDQFVHDVMASRQLPEEEVRKIADGRVFTGQKAFELKLVDKLGSLDAAVRDGLSQWSPEKTDYVFEYPYKESGFFRFLNSLGEKSEALTNMMSSAHQGFYYVSREAL